MTDVVGTSPIVDSVSVDWDDDDAFGGGNPAMLNLTQACAGKPVDCSTGNQFERQTDLAVGGIGGLEATRTYNSAIAARSASGTPLGYGWSLTFSDFLSVSDDVVTVHQSNGSTTRFVHVGGRYVTPRWVQATLSRRTDGTYVYTLPDRTRMLFGSSGRLESVEDADGNATTMTYNTAGRLSAATDPDGRQLTYSYDGSGYLWRVTGPGGRQVLYSIDAGELVAVSYSTESSPLWEFGYDAAHQLTEMTDAEGGTTLTWYDAQHRATSQTDALGRTRTWAYSGNATTVTNPNGEVTRTVFAEGQPTSVTRGYGTSSASTTNFSYDDNTRAVLSITDPEGRVTSYDYDTDGNRTKEVLPGGRTSRWTYNSSHDLLTATTPSGRITRYVRDAHGRPTQIKRTLAVPGGPDQEQITSLTYDSAGNPVATTDPRNQTTTRTFDGRGNALTETDPLGRTTSWTYDAWSRVLSTTTPRGNAPGANTTAYTTTLTRDARGRVVATTDGSGRTTHTTYDRLDHVIAATDGAGRVTTYTYDAEGQQTAVTEPGNLVTSATYDANGAVSSVTDAATHTTTYTHDLLGRLTKTTDPLGRESEMEYDLSGRLLNTTTEDGEDASYAYSAPGDLTAVDYSDAGTADETFAYDSDGRRTSVTDGTGTTTFAYDSLDRLTSTTDGDGATVGYGYDIAGNQTSLVYPGGATVTRTFDEAGQTSQISDWLGDTITFSYDADGNRTTTTYPSSSGLVEHRSYDRAGRVIWIVTKQAGSTVQSFAYGYENDEQVTSTASGGAILNVEAYDYDPQARLVAANTDAFSYDGAGNVTSLRGATLGYDAAGQLTTQAASGGTTGFTYDLRGNRVAANPPTGPPGVYAYDQADRLLSATPSGGATVTYTHDASGLRTSRTIGSTTTSWTWDRSSELPLLLQEGGSRYVYGPDGGVLWQVDASGDMHIALADNLGSVRVITNAAGTVTATRSYDAYGATRTASGSSTIPFGYAGQYTDSATGLQYLRARDYDPQTGQFLSRDPLESATGAPYAYASGDPINQIDPTGLFPWGAIGNAVAGALDGASMGATKWIRQQVGVDFVNYCSAAYSLGSGGGTALSFAIPGLGELRAAKLADKGARVLKVERRALPKVGRPNSTDVVDRGNGKGQIRDYGPDGQAQKDFDFGHDHGAGDPHAHDWIEGRRSPGRPIRSGE